MALEWKGVMPAMTTCFKEDLSIDRDFAATHARWLVNHGCTGIVTPGSLGEGATLTFEGCPLANLRSRGRGRRADRRRNLLAEHGGGRAVGAKRGRSGVRRVDGPAALCVQERLA